ncbi:MAG: mannose-6-phosphate isomerase [Maricaulis maris]|uniref:Mannose-6-phosphate isomerase, type 3 n=1 Tax=Maricaulis maris (strain MCS10) TaxID=394221 RepID=Q0ALW9_MARMM|nr:AGE family epimerase/isomerase [Maricaulis maris]ABI66724.1 mannose-6-phosphate isomerase, type 3 [Maricaulis maris MCS10]
MIAIDRYAEWFKATALPFWQQRAWDPQSGGFLESVNLDGSPVFGDSRRVRTQARQVYVFARSHLAGWCNGHDLAVDGYALLEQRAKAPDGQDGWVHRLTDTGAVESPIRDLYDHTFILLAQAWLFRLTGDARYRHEADSLLAYLDREFADPAGGYAESLGGPQLPRRQNPHMHFFECMLAWHEVSGDQSYLDRAEAVLELLGSYFIDQAGGYLVEFFDRTWRPDESDDGIVVEPGHELEWVWLLDAYQRTGRSVSDEMATRLFQHAHEFGLNRHTGFMMSASTSAGRPIEGGSRTWVQTEWLRGALARHRCGASGALAQAEVAATQLLKWHIDPAIRGGWIDSVDARGSQTADRIPASTFYHLLGVVLDVEKTG